MDVFVKERRAFRLRDCVETQCTTIFDDVEFGKHYATELEFIYQSTELDI